jgi:hypothetical protein
VGPVGPVVPVGPVGPAMPWGPVGPGVNPEICPVEALRDTPLCTISISSVPSMLIDGGRLGICMLLLNLGIKAAQSLALHQIHTASLGR